MVVLSGTRTRLYLTPPIFISKNNMEERKDRHREGYYKEYAERTGKKDRHSADYYKKYRERKKLEKEATSSSTDVSSASSSSDTSSISNTETEKKAKSKKKDRRAYYREYNRKHPERLNRGFIKWYVNGNVSDGAINQSYGIRVLGYDELGRPITNDPFGDILRNKEMEWHDDDWCEEPD